MGLYVFGSPIYFVMIVIICALCFIIIIKYEVWPIGHYLGLGHETIVRVTCLCSYQYDTKKEIVVK